MFNDPYFDPYCYDDPEDGWVEYSGRTEPLWIVCAVNVIALTRKGLLIAPGGDAPSGWYPRSYVTLEGGTGPTVLSIPDWLIAEKCRTEIKFDTAD